MERWCKLVAIDKNNGSTLWQDAIEKQMENVRVAFQTTPEDKKAPSGYEYINCYMVFDIKMKDFHRKECLVTGGHITHTLDGTTYSSVITEKLCILPLLW